MEISKVPGHVVQCTRWEDDAKVGNADFEALSLYIQFHAENEKLHGVALGHALYLGYTYWDQCPYDYGLQYDFDYMTWAISFSGKSEKVVPQYRRVGELFEDMRTGRVEVPERVLLVDGRGDLVLDEVDDDVIPVETEPNIYSPDLPFSKLLIGRHKARSEEGFDEQDWGMVFNPDVTVEEFRQHLLQGDDYGWEPDPNKFSAWVEGTMVLVSENGQTAAIVDSHGLNVQALEGGDQLALKAFDKMARCLGLEDPFNGDF